MAFREHFEPRPHIVIDDFFPAESLKEIWRDILRLESEMQIGLQGASVNLYDDDMKKNQLVVVNDTYRLNGEKIGLLESVRARVWSPFVLERLRVANDGLFQLLEYCEGHFVQVSAYGDGDFYGAHFDSNPVPNLTLVIFLCREPKPFSGGDFVLGEGETSHVVEFKNNRAILFPSNTLHRVIPVELADEKYENLRFSLQVWPKVKGVEPKRAVFTTVNVVPTFEVDQKVLAETKKFFDVAELNAKWTGDLNVALSAMKTTLEVLSSNLKYLARGKFGTKNLPVHTEVKCETAGISVTDIFAEVRNSERVLRFGYLFCAGRGLDPKLKFYVKAPQGQAMTENISFSTTYDSMRTIFDQFVEQIPSSGSPSVHEA